MTLVSYMTRMKKFRDGQSGVSERPGETCPGGGMNSKAWNVGRAVDANLVWTLAEVKRGAVLIDTLVLTEDGAPLEPSIEALEACQLITLLWNEEQQFLRLTHQQRLALVKVVDKILVSNVYLQNILREFDIDSDVLYTPIDSEFYRPLEKKPQLVTMGQVSVVKNTRGIIDFFRAVPADIECVFIGSAGLWGKVNRPADKALEAELSQVCRWIPSASRREVSEILGGAWGYLNMARYDVGCLSFLEAGLAGCHCFAWRKHLMFDEYENVTRFDGVKDGVEILLEKWTSEGGHFHEALRSELELKHSYASFRTQLRGVLGGIYVD